MEMTEHPYPDFDAEVDIEIARRCRTAYVMDVRQAFLLTRLGDDAQLGTHVVIETIGPRLRFANVDKLGSEYDGSIGTAHHMDVLDQLPPIADLLERIADTVDIWAEEQLGRPLTDEERAATRRHDRGRQADCP